jgi:alpha-galactosidase
VDDITVGRRRNRTLIFLILAFFAFANTVQGQNEYHFDESDITIEGSLRPFMPTISVEQISMSRYQVYFALHSSAPSQLPDFSMTFKFPKNKINQLWNSQTWSNKSYFSLPSYDRATADFSIISGLTLNDQNQITFTCSDRFDSRFATTFVKEQNDTLEFGVTFFEDNPPRSSTQDYVAQILIDFRNIHFSQAVYEASKWRFQKVFNYAALKSNRSVAPVYSTWYPMHRGIPLENISRELDSLRTFGFKSILIDDSWRSLVKLKVDTVYDYEKADLKNLKLLIEKSNAMDMKLYLWYSLPFMGGNPVITKKFKGKYLRYKDPQQIYVLDPRYLDVRNHLVSTYYNFYKDWLFDGIWFDFINNFYPDEPIVVSEDLGRDFTDVQLAVDSLMAGMVSRLQSVNPNVFMGQEFNPVGPDQNHDRNFIVGFVGVDGTKLIREKMVNNRILYGRYTPFMEIMGIHPRDKSEDVARKFQSIMFGNPHLSFFTTTLPDDAKQTIRFWLNYWKENHEVLMESDFEPQKVANMYPIIKVKGDEKIIYALYGDYTLSLPLAVDRPIDVINSKETTQVQFLVNEDGNSYKYKIFNHLGDMVEQGDLKVKRKNSIQIEIPEAGFIRFLPN